MTKRTAIALMKKHNISGDVSGVGENFRVVLPDTATMERFRALVADFGGIHYDDGACCLYSADSTRGDPGDPTSAHHY